MAAFAECAKVNSLWVVINCRQQNKQSKSLSEKVADDVKMPMCPLLTGCVWLACSERVPEPVYDRGAVRGMEG